MVEKSKFLLPPPVRKGDLVAVVAPSGPFDPKLLELGCELLRSWELEPVYRPTIFSKWGNYLAGSDTDRLQWLLESLKNPKIKAVIAARGGYGALRLLPKIDWKQLSKLPPKRVIGFSDITALHGAISKKLNWISFSGPMLASRLLAEGSSESILSFQNALFSEDVEQILPKTKGTSLAPGKRRGHLVGGNLSLIASLIGTEYQFEMDGAILFLEEVGEPLYRIDRLFHQLSLAGILDQIAGLALGDFGTTEFTPQFVREFLLPSLQIGRKIPIVAELPFGHIRENLTLPLGALCEIDGNSGTVRAVHR